MKNYVFLFAVILITNISCANHPCREPRSPQEVASTAAQNHVFVAKSDGTKQCEKKKGISIDVMEKQLKSIKVYSKSSKSDGLMRTQVCGADTGYFNVFEIEASDLEKAKALGFKEWSN